jgi:hypothetical protein
MRPSTVSRTISAATAAIVALAAGAGCMSEPADEPVLEAAPPTSLGTGGAGGEEESLGGFDAAEGGSSAGGFAPIPVRELPGLESITFYERTGGEAPTLYTFAVDGPELTTRLPDPLSEAGHDIPGAESEYYDVYYSDEKGEIDPEGSYLTISGAFGLQAPMGGGLNLAEIGLNFSGSPPEFGNWVASYVALGDNQDESAVASCIDGDLQTHTTMGNTAGATERLRLTLGFESSSGPPPPPR